MQVILLEHVARLGGVGDVVDVKGGYGRNFLVPQGKAIRATKKNVAEIEAQKDALNKQNAEKRTEAEKQASKLGKLSVKIVRQASEDGKLFGSVAVRDVVTALTEKGHAFTRQQVDLNSAIKTLGLYSASIRLHPEVIKECDIEVVRNLESSAYDEIEDDKEPVPAPASIDEDESDAA